MANVGTITILLGVTTSGINKGIRDTKRLERSVQSSAVGMQASVTSLNTALLNFGRVMTQFATFPALVLGGFSTKSFSQFEFNLSKVTGLIGIAKDTTEEWGESIKDLGSVVGLGPTKLSEALYFVTTGGVRGAETMEVLEVAAKAAATGMGDVSEIADVVVSAMNAYGKENLSAAQAADILTVSVREGKAEADKLVQSFGVVLPIASKMGVTFDQVGAALAAMTRTGTRASTAGQQLRQILNKLINPTNETNAALRIMETSAAELRKKIKDDGLLDTLIHLNDLTKQYGEDAITHVFPRIRALTGVLDILGNNLQQNIKIEKELANAQGALNAAFDEVAQTWRFKVNTVLAEGQSLLIELGSAITHNLAPAVSDLLSTLRDWTNNFAQLDRSTQQIIVQMIKLAAVLGPAIVLFNVLRNSVLLPLSVMYLRLDKVMSVMLGTTEKQRAAQAKFSAEVHAHAMRMREKTWATQNATAANEVQNASLARSAMMYANLNKLLAQYTLFMEKATTRTAAAGVSRQLSLPVHQAMLALPAARLTKTQVLISGISVAAGKAKTALMGLGAALVNIGKSLLMVIGRFVMLNGYLGIIAILGTAIYGTVKQLGKLEDASKKAFDTLNNSLTESKKLAVEEQAQLKRLAATVQNERLPEEVRAKAIKTLQDIAPDYLGTLDMENALTKIGTELIDNYSKAIERASKARQIELDLLKLEREQIEAVQTGRDKELTYWEKARKGGVVYATFGRILGVFVGKQKEVSWESEKAANSLEAYKKSVKLLTREQERAIYNTGDFIRKLEGIQSTVNKLSADDEAGSIKAVQKRIRKQIEAEELYQNYYVKARIDRLKEDENARKLMARINASTNNEERAMLELMYQEHVNYLNSTTNSYVDASEQRIKILQKELNKVKGILDEQSHREIQLQLKLDYEKIFVDLEEELNKLGRFKILMEGGAGGNFNILEDQVNAYKKALETASGFERSLNDERVKALQLNLTTVQLALDLLDKESRKIEALSEHWEGYIEVQTQSQRKTDELAQSYIIAEAMLNEWKMSQMGWTKEFYNSSEALDEFKRIVDSLGKSGEVTSAQMRELMQGLSQWTISDLFSQMDMDIEELNLKASLLGNTFSVADEKVRIYGNTLRRVLNTQLSDLDMTKDQWDEWLGKVKSLSNELQNLQMQLNISNKLIDSSADLITQFFMASSNVEDVWKRMGQTILSVISDIIKLLVKQIIVQALATTTTEKAAEASSRKALKDMESAAVNTILESQQKRFNETLAIDTVQKELNTKATNANTEATVMNYFASQLSEKATKDEGKAKLANMLFSKLSTGQKQKEAMAGAVNAGVSVTEKGAKQPFPMNIIAIAVGVAAVIGAIAMIKRASSTVKMAEGGIIPPGYPNDTYPALLTSGETVVPPGKLPDDFNMRPSVIRLEGEFRAKGRDLVYIIREEERRMGNVY